MRTQGSIGARVGKVRWAAALAATAILLVTSASQADQAAWISRKDADAGAARIGVGTEIRAFCAPCGDKAYGPVTVASVAVAKPAMDPKGPYFEVRVNGEGIDMAYTYVLSKGHWMNLAMQVGVHVTDVPAELPPALPRK